MSHNFTNNKCYEFCKKLGFVENNNRENEMLDFLDNLKEFINKDCLNLFDKIKEKIEITYNC